MFRIFPARLFCVLVSALSVLAAQPPAVAGDVPVVVPPGDLSALVPHAIDGWSEFEALALMQAVWLDDEESAEEAALVAALAGATGPVAVSLNGKPGTLPAPAGGAAQILAVGAAPLDMTAAWQGGRPGLRKLSLWACFGRQHREDAAAFIAGQMRPFHEETAQQHDDRRLQDEIARIASLLPDGEGSRFETYLYPEARMMLYEGVALLDGEADGAVDDALYNWLEPIARP